MEGHAGDLDPSTGGRAAHIWYWLHEGEFNCVKDVTHIEGPHRRAGPYPKTSCATQTGLHGERGKKIKLKVG